MANPTNHTQDEIGAFVIAAHGNPEQAMTLLAADPSLLHTRWERTGETALDGAAHTGQADLARHLLAAGAPLDIFTAAMLGRTDDVIAFLDEDASLVGAVGAHGIPLLVYAGLSGKVELLDLLVEPADVGVGDVGHLLEHQLLDLGPWQSLEQHPAPWVHQDGVASADRLV